MTSFPYRPASPEALAARWVQWVAATGPLRNPVADDTGAHAHRRQPADVWFLAGCFGGAVERRCTVPAGRPLFFPAFNMWGPDVEPIPEATGEAHVDDVRHPVEPIDATEPFEVRGAFLNPVTRTRGPVPVRVWGLWARVDPLTPGEHRVRFTGSDGHGFRVAAMYELTVA
ncbi:hypothetical protein Daura_29040 [Dactylosporangium aurantiacum]|uniref:Uncharacterized protein n=1 Tax=Dactylosporangium aurantiacum TaxID=35754 RepID=A0A9Q9I7P8_9ACTN|nr:hypothetical protein [Dactylosporangium aurantiacum]MDG6106700.1 hypothetical protein [Dactylosporangium aurantiacum]UWZ50852.1 hypothetical protein Daura_29040 [Dactylosporangium aurantiacum]